LESDEFQAALAEAEQIKHSEIAKFREMPGRSSAPRNLNKIS
jgi:hypothetical protein